MLWLSSGNGQSKTAYIDPPLLKAEMSWRERNLMFHEESIKVALNNNVSRQNPIFLLASEDLSLEMDRPPEVLKETFKFNTQLNTILHKR